MARPNKTESAGFNGTPEWRVWRSIIQRCEHKSNSVYSYYGGRGIKMCVRWRRSFKNFLEDVGKKPSPKHELDRKDTDGHYDPENCRWVTRSQNMRNMRRNRSLTANGETKLLVEWAELLGCNHTTILQRLKYGWSEEAAVTTPVGHFQNANK